MNLKNLFLLGICLFLFFGCDETIIFLEQPTSANTGDIIQINITVNSTGSGGQNSTGAGIIKLPENWKILNVSYKGYINDNLYEYSYAYNDDYLKAYNSSPGYKLYYLKGNKYIYPPPSTLLM